MWQSDTSQKTTATTPEGIQMVWKGSEERADTDRLSVILAMNPWKMAKSTFTNLREGL